MLMGTWNEACGTASWRSRIMIPWTTHARGL
jgi:hypothetical protein